MLTERLKAAAQRLRVQVLGTPKLGYVDLHELGSHTIQDAEEAEERNKLSSEYLKA